MAGEEHDTVNKEAANTLLSALRILSMKAKDNDQHLTLDEILSEIPPFIINIKGKPGKVQ
jgi:hypothetical protein